MIIKPKFVLVFLSLATLLFGCTNNHNNNVIGFRLSDEYYTSENKGLTYADYQSSIAIKKEESASFASLVYLSGCPSCALFIPIVEKYATSNNLRFYAVDALDIRNSDSELFQTIKYAPSFVIYKEGTLFTFLDSGKDEHIDYFKSLSGFRTWFETYVDITPSNLIV